jgi:cytoskeletal protein RodZ
VKKKKKKKKKTKKKQKKKKKKKKKVFLGSKPKALLIFHFILGFPWLSHSQTRLVASYRYVVFTFLTLHYVQPTSALLVKLI